MGKYRILKNGYWYFIQKKLSLFFWRDNLNSKWHICNIDGYIIPPPYYEYQKKHYKTLKEAEKKINEWKEIEKNYKNNQKITFIKKYKLQSLLTLQRILYIGERKWLWKKRETVNVEK